MLHGMSLEGLVEEVRKECDRICELISEILADVRYVQSLASKISEDARELKYHKTSDAASRLSEEIDALYPQLREGFKDFRSKILARILHRLPEVR